MKPDLVWPDRNDCRTFGPVLLLLLSVMLAPSASAEVATQAVNGAGTPPGTKVSTVYDVSDRMHLPETTADRAAIETAGLRLARALRNYNQTHAVYFVITCHIEGAPLATDRNSSMCTLYPSWTVSKSELMKIVQAGMRLGNHTNQHVPELLQTVPAFLDDLSKAQRVLDLLQPDDGIRTFSPPGAGIGASYMAAVDADPYLTQLSGPIVPDINTVGVVNGVTLVGDTQFYNKGLSAQAIVDFMRETLKAREQKDRAAGIQQGYVLAFHIRTEVLDGSDLPYQTILLFAMQDDHIPIPVDALKGMLGDTHTGEFIKWSGDFAGQKLVFGDITRTGMPVPCHSEIAGIFCSLPERGVQTGLVTQDSYRPSAPVLVLPIRDNAWLVKYGKQFVIAPDGTILYPGSQGIMQAQYDGERFGPTEKAFDHFADEYQFTFGDMDGDGWADLIAWTPKNGGTIYIMRNKGPVYPGQSQSAGYEEPIVGSTEYPAKEFGGDAYRVTLTAGRMGIKNPNGSETLEGICMRGAKQVFCSPSNGRTLGPKIAMTPLTEKGGDYSDDKLYNIPVSAESFRIIYIDGKPHIAAGWIPGISFADLDIKANELTNFRMLNNEDYTSYNAEVLKSRGYSDWKPERQGQVYFVRDKSGTDKVFIHRLDGSIYKSDIIYPRKDARSAACDGEARSRSSCGGRR